MTSGLQPPNIAGTSASQTMTNAFVTANWTDGLSFLLNPPIFVGYNVTTQTVASGSAGAAVLLTSEVSDTYSGHSITTNTSRYVAQVPGWYWVSGSVCFTPNATGDRKAMLAVNGTLVGYSNGQIPTMAPPSGPAVVVPATLIYLNGNGDYVEIWAFQDSGSPLTINPNSGNASSMSLCWAHM